VNFESYVEIPYYLCTPSMSLFAFFDEELMQCVRIEKIKSIGLWTYMIYDIQEFLFHMS
jgi:hypothetical protein